MWKLVFVPPFYTHALIIGYISDPPRPQLELAYKSVILDRYPKSDRRDSPLPAPVALFCQPQVCVECGLIFEQMLILNERVFSIGM
jgi:hypothetical protein